MRVSCQKIAGTWPHRRPVKGKGRGWEGSGYRYGEGIPPQHSSEAWNLKCICIFKDHKHNCDKVGGGYGTPGAEN